MKGTKALGPAVMLFLALGAPLPDALAGVTSVTSCVTITKSGSYLVSQVLKHNGDCIKVQVDFVTIDLGGFMIKGNGTGKAVTDNGTSRRGIIVRNGMISSFQTGISFATGSSPGDVFENLSISDTSDTGISAGPGSIIHNNTLDQTGSTAVTAGAGSLVSGNTITDTGGAGIIADDASIVKDNAVTDGSAVGIIAAAGSTLTGNTVTGNATRGLSITCPSTVVENTATDNPPGCTPMVNCFNLVLTGSGCTNANNTAP